MSALARLFARPAAARALRAIVPPPRVALSCSHARRFSSQASAADDATATAADAPVPVSSAAPFHPVVPFRALTWDKILVRNMRFFAHHGVYPHETATGQPFEVDVELTLDLSDAAHTDDLEHTVHYGTVHAAVKAVVEDGPPVKLLEHLSLRIIDTLLAEFPPIHEVKVQLRKPKVGMPGHLDFAGVEMARIRSSMVELRPEALNAEQDEPLPEYPYDEYNDELEYEQEADEPVAEQAEERPAAVGQDEDDELNGKVRADITRRAPNPAPSKPAVAQAPPKPLTELQKLQQLRKNNPNMTAAQERAAMGFDAPTQKPKPKQKTRKRN